MSKEKQLEPDRTPEEASQMAREVMKRMLQTPPTPHVPKEKAAKKKSKSRRR